MKKGAYKILRDMIPVILGVLIALYIEDWKTQQENEKFLNGVLDSIEKEMTDYREDLTEVLEKQYALVDTINLYLEDPNVTVTDCFIKTNGLQVVPVKTNSWWSFLNTKIQIVGYETISSLSSIEASKQFMRVKIEKMMDFVYAHSESTEVKHKRMLLIQISNIIDSEEGLLKAHDEYLGPKEDSTQSSEDDQ